MTPTGVLSVSTAPRLRNVLMKCVAMQPAAVIVDLNSVLVEAPATLSLFGMVARRTADWASVRLVLVAEHAADGLDPGQTAIARFVDVYPTMRSAQEAVRRPPTCRLAYRKVPLATRRLAPTRAFVTATCQAWDCATLADDASLIADELVVNALRHAHTDALLRLDLRPGMLIVSVSDSGGGHPLLADLDLADISAHGYGLALVAGLARSWGTVPIDCGKIVWAAIAA